MPAFPDNELTRYALTHSAAEPAILQHIRRETHLKVLHPQMLSEWMQGSLLQAIVRMIQPKRVLEIGSFTGYSAVAMGLALPEDSQLLTIERNDELMPYLQRHIAAAGLEDKVEAVCGNAAELLPTLTSGFDLIFIDADKPAYPFYYQLAKEKLRRGGWMLLDNVLWDSKVLAPSSDSDANILDALNKTIRADKQVVPLMLPLRDGLTLLQKVEQ